jgi:hypothetical protein
MTKPKRYLTAPQTRERYGGRSNMWLWRMEHGADPDWPRPIIIRGKKFYDEAELDAFDASRRVGEVA